MGKGAGSAEGRRLRGQNQLKDAYTSYIVVKRCYNSREGYLITYTSDAELSKAKAAVSSLEEKLKDRDMDLDALWTKANSLADGLLPLGSFTSWGYDAIKMRCTGASNQLTQIYMKWFPEAATTKKTLDAAVSGPRGRGG